MRYVRGMAFTRLSSKRQVTIPVRILRKLGWQLGEPLLRKVVRGGIAVIPVKKTKSMTKATSL